MDRRPFRVRRKGFPFALALAVMLFDAGLPLVGMVGRAAAAGPGQPAVLSATGTDLAASLRARAPGQRVRIEGLELEGIDGAPGLDLERFDVLAPGASLVVQEASGPRAFAGRLPVWLRGSVDGMRNSVVVLSVRDSGEIRGVVSGTGRTWALSAPGRSGRARAGALRAKKVDRVRSPKGLPFECDTLENPTPARSVAAPSGAGGAAGGEEPPPVAGLPIAFTAQVAVELDYDYFQLFAPDADAAVLYALDLMAFTGTIGEAEIGANVQVPFLQLWTVSSDPFSGGDLTRLGQIRSRWNQNGSTNCGGVSCTTIDRSTVILLSSAGSGGVAYVPALCDSWHSPTGGFSYAFAGSLGGSFDIDSPSAVWDIVVAAHELGHNFGSTHTHCYSPPVDGCYGSEPGCYAGPSGLPSGCPGSGQGCGTIMSYCHLQPGGLTNVSLTYGAGHPYGDTPDRVPNTIISRFTTEALAAPGCLDPTGGMVELTVATAGGGTGTVTSSPAAIDCGDACRTYFDAGTVVTLTPNPGTFSDFTGWSGDPDCLDGEVSMAAATSCTATFDGNCGAGNENCDDGDPCTVDTCPLDDHCENAGMPRDPGTCYGAARTAIKVKDIDPDSRDKLLWLWRVGDTFEQDDLGNPTTSTDYTVCVYDSTASVSSLSATMSLPAGGLRWKNRSPRGWAWSDRDADFDGIKKLILKPGDAGKTKVKLLVTGLNAPLPGPVSGSAYFDEDPSVVVQLLNDDGACWTSEFLQADTQQNSATTYRGKGN